MNVRKVKRKCNVRGCKNTDCFAIARTHEIGNGVIICRSCLQEGLAAVEEYNPCNKKEKRNRQPPPLFFNTIARGQSTATKIQPESVEGGSDITNLDSDLSEDKEQPIHCTRCGKQFKSKAGLSRHASSCDAKKTDKEVEL